MIWVDELIIQNFLPYRDRQRIFLANQGVVRLEAVNRDIPNADSNMVGKSSIVEAIVWCFFGRTLRTLPNKDAVVHRTAGKDCFVRIFFHTEKTRYAISRYRKHTKFGNALRLFAGGQLISHRHEDDTQKRLEAILGADFTSFSNSIVFGGFRPFAALTDAEQKKVLESFLHFEQIDEALKRTKTEIAEKNHLLTEFSLEIAKVEGRASAEKLVLRTIRANIREFHTNRQRKIAGHQKAIKTLESQMLPYKDCRARLETLEQSEKGYVAEIEKYSRIESETAADMKRILQKIDDLGVRVATVQADSVCPTCLMELTKDRLTILGKKMLAEIGSYEEAVRSIEHKLKGVATIHSNLKKNLAQTAVQIETQTREVEDLAVLERAKESHQDRIDILKEQTPPSKFSLERHVVQHLRCVKALLKLDHERRKLQQEVEDLFFWLEGFGNRGIKAIIVRDALPALNSKLAEYAGAIFGGAAKAEFAASKSTKSGEERELFHLEFDNPKGGASYGAESTGGQHRINICILLCFAWLSRTADLLLVDELLDGLDESGREVALNILAKLRGTVLVITHRKELKAQLGKVWTVTKDGGFSVIRTSE